MTLKRKLELDCDDELSPINAKQLKLFPFPNSDNDSVMMDAEPSPHYHTRLLSDVSSSSSNASDSPLATSPYPSFSYTPLPFFDNSGSVNPDSHNYSHYVAQSQRSPSIGLLQPSNTFTHHGTGCSQIPKLRVACAPGLNGQRTMWSFCEQCGAISMVDNE